MKHTLAALFLVLICASMSFAQDNWMTTGLLSPTIPTPLSVNAPLLDYQNIYDQEAKPTVKIMAASSITAVIAIQRIGADGTTVIHEQALIVNAFTTFQMELTVQLQDDEHLRIVNKVALSSGSLWVSLITN